MASLVENTWSIVAGALYDKGVPRPKLKGSVEHDGVIVSYVTVIPDVFVLNCSYLGWDAYRNRALEKAAFQVRVDWQPCTLGGVRPYLWCPRCEGRRVTRLYLDPPELPADPPPTRPMSAVYLQQALPDARELLQTVVGSAIQVHVAVAASTEPVSVDATELELALTNLALNARDALPQGGELWIEARLAHSDDSAGLSAGRYVLLSVTDNGKGISDDLMARVFEPFFTTKTAAGGTGFSLAQVLGFCVQAGGTARIANHLLKRVRDFALVKNMPKSLPRLPGRHWKCLMWTT